MINTKTRTKEDINDTSILISDIEVAKKLINIYQSSQDRKLEFNLSFEYVKRLLEYKTCYYTNIPFTEEGPFARSFDRVESDKGYIEGNVVACTIDINGKKANLSPEEISCLDKKLNKRREKNKPNKKILILGSARSGKDTLAEILNKEFGTTYIASSEAANNLFIFDKLKTKYGYKTKKECFKDRVNHRDEWYNLICEYNIDDKAKLAKDIMKKADCYVGMRDNEEFLASKHLFDIIIWVDASDRLPSEIGTFNISKNEADFIIENNTTLEDFTKRAINIGKLLKK